MYTQFFGNYLLQKGLITQVQLMQALSRMSDSRLKLGTLAISEGLMTAGEVDECLYMQTREDKRFGEIAIARGYLTDEQVKSLLEAQSSDFLLLGQLLVEDDVFSYEDLERAIFDYQSENEIYDLELDVDNKDKIHDLIEKFFEITETTPNEKILLYLELLFNSLIRFIGEDFTPLNPILAKEFPVTYAASQKITGDNSYITYIDMDRDTAIQFASRYAKEEFLDYNEYVMAAIEDFINLHNGLFLVNASNELGNEERLYPPEIKQDIILETESNFIVFPVIYPFGTIHLIVEI